MKDKVKFACDCMCGKLAKRLRMLGFDVFYKKYILDEDLVNFCENQNRILLTKDRGILKRKTETDIYIVKGKNPDEEIVEIIRKFNLKKLVEPFTKCIVCGCDLEFIEKAKVKNKVPPFVFRIQKKFKICLKCEKIYWPATHKERMDSSIELWLA